MTPVQFLADLTAQSVRLAAEGDRLRVDAPPDVLTPEVLETLARHKATLLTLLRPARVPPYAFPWPDTVPGLGTRKVVPFDLCSACQAGTWVGYGETRLCLACAQGLVSRR